MTHGCRCRIAPVVLARAPRHELRPPTTLGSVPHAPGHIANPLQAPRIAWPGARPRRGLGCAPERQRVGTIGQTAVIPHLSHLRDHGEAGPIGQGIGSSWFALQAPASLTIGIMYCCSWGP